MNDSDEESCEANVPFSWEHKPGVSKVTNHHHHQEVSVDVWHFMLKLPPPPPCSSRSSPSFSFDGFQIPIPHLPAVLQAPISTNISFKKGLITRKQEDPFLVAYKKCTETPQVNTRKSKFSTRSLSCKYSCIVAGDNLIRMSQVPRPISRRRQERERDYDKRDRGQ